MPTFKTNTQSHASDIPNRLDLVWMSSALRQDHVGRITQWKKLNPDYEVTILVDQKYINEIKKQLAHADVCVEPLDQLKIPQKVLNFINAVINFKDPRYPNLVNNYAVPSDIYRFYLLLKGSWYSDTDVEPIDLNTIPINPQFKFIFNGARSNNEVEKLEPSLIANSENHPLIQKGIEFIEQMCEVINNPAFISLLNSPIASVRLRATQATTGVTLRAALGKMTVDNKPILHLWNELDNQIPDGKVYDEVAYEFSGDNECSWLFSKFKVNHGHVSVTTLKGVTLDPAFKNQNYFPTLFPMEDDFICRIVTYLSDLYDKISPTNLSENLGKQKYELFSRFKQLSLFAYHSPNFLQLQRQETKFTKLRN